MKRQGFMEKYSGTTSSRAARPLHSLRADGDASDVKEFFAVLATLRQTDRPFTLTFKGTRYSPLLQMSVPSAVIVTA